jgi:hypothetical protein
MLEEKIGSEKTSLVVTLQVLSIEEAMQELARQEADQKV